MKVTHLLALSLLVSVGAAHAEDSAPAAAAEQPKMDHHAKREARHHKKHDKEQAKEQPPEAAPVASPDKK